METKNYYPAQPFWSRSTKNFETLTASPTGALAQYYNFTVPSDKDQELVAVPDGTIDIIFRCSNNDPYALVYGSVLKGKYIHFKKDAQYFGVRFYPGAAELCLGCPLDLFTDQNVNLNDIHSSVNELIDLISTAA